MPNVYATMVQQRSLAAASWCVDGLMLCGISADFREAYAYVLGAKGSGKTAITTMCVRPGSDRKGSNAVDFSCIRKVNVSGKSDIACIWELPGTEALAAAVASKDKVRHTLQQEAHLPSSEQLHGTTHCMLK
jgi:hypothetical protein